MDKQSYSIILFCSNFNNSNILTLILMCAREVHIFPQGWMCDMWVGFNSMYINTIKYTNTIWLSWRNHNVVPKKTFRHMSGIAYNIKQSASVSLFVDINKISRIFTALKLRRMDQSPHHRIKLVSEMRLWIYMNIER